MGGPAAFESHHARPMELARSDSSSLVARGRVGVTINQEIDTKTVVAPPDSPSTACSFQPIPPILQLLPLLLLLWPEPQLYPPTAPIRRQQHTDRDGQLQPIRTGSEQTSNSQRLHSPVALLKGPDMALASVFRPSESPTLIGGKINTPGQLAGSSALGAC